MFGVKIVAADLEHDRLNVRFDLPDGRGSFGETLVRRKPGSGAKRKVCQLAVRNARALAKSARTTTERASAVR